MLGESTRTSRTGTRRQSRLGSTDATTSRTLSEPPAITNSIVLLLKLSLLSLVLYHSFGITHNPRIEDFPVVRASSLAPGYELNPPALTDAL